MLKRVLSYFLFLFKSTNQHGVHSPFVYSYLTEGVYDTKKSYKGYQKKHRLLQATIEYFQVQKAIGKPEFPIYPSREKTKHLGKEKYANLHYIEAIETYSSESLDRLIKAIDANTILYIDSPYESAKANNNWLTLKENKKFHVSIDFYIAGVLFTREEQEKEHFALRV